MAAALVVGARVRFTHPLPDGGTLRFSARVVRLNADGSATVRIPDLVRRIPFPPAGGAMFARYNRIERGPVMDSRLDGIARMLEELDRKGDAECKLSPDARRLLTRATIAIRHEADTRGDMIARAASVIRESDGADEHVELLAELEAGR